ncbi:hypothetical protein EST38_g12525 [Candolleomyces aberdarensis]|uniref:CCHC-type domain-containing protein n=1 Tax=Candolleomyces aberdarensis TaxID=2316362 RepID=A0A4Q2D4F5_9AGAR|nr:hypothetical protein EST38_g12525 [Candolleomyces aberdarensis]
MSQDQHYAFPPDPNVNPNPNAPLFNLDDTQQVPIQDVPPTSTSFTFPDLDDDRTALWRGVYALGRNFESFVERQAVETHANQAALNAIVERLASGSAPSTSGGSGAPKFREPRVFNGRADQVDGFLREIENAMYLQRRSLTTDRDRVLYMGSFLGDGFPRFRQHFEQSDQYADALRKLGELKQTGSAAAFTSRFLELTARLDWTDQTKIQEYWNRLKDSVKGTLINRRGRYFTTSFDTFWKECVSIDNEVHQFELNCRAAKKISAPAPSHAQHPFHQPTSSATTSAPESDVVPMEIDAVRRGPLSDEEKARRRSLGLCLYCGQGKHFVKDCPNKSAKAKTVVTKGNPSSGKA